MSTIHVFGIPNCDITKKAINWLKEQKVDFEFHDYKKEGINNKKISDWSKQVGWETLLNKRGTTWKKIDTGIQQTITDQKAAIALMQKETSLIKRPVIEVAGKILTGFDNKLYEKVFL
jgi:Spx/MgsR family transcriptional regulator